MSGPTEELRFQALTWNKYQEDYYTKDGVEKSRMIISCHGRNEEGPVSVLIHGFRPFLYIQIPTQTNSKKEIIWSDYLTIRLKNLILSECSEAIVEKVDKFLLCGYPQKTASFVKVSFPTESLYYRFLREKEDRRKAPLIRGQGPLEDKRVVEKPVDKVQDSENKEPGQGSVGPENKEPERPKKRTFMSMDIKLNDGTTFRAPLYFYDLFVDNIIKFTAIQNIRPAGWISCQGRREHGQFVCHWTNVTGLTDPSLPTLPISVLSIDFECNSTDQYSFPDASRPEDYLFQISCVYQDVKGEIQKYLISMKDCAPIDGATVINCQKDSSNDSETELLHQFGKLIKKLDPDLVIGYNINMFDWRYLFERFADNPGYQSFLAKTSRTINASTKDESTWRSSAYGEVKIIKLSMPGRTVIDVYNVIRRDFKMESYSLNEVSKVVLGDNKDDLKYSEMFQLFRTGSPADMARIGKYCLIDSELALKIFNKLQLYIGSVEQANVDMVPISYLSTRGTQVRMVSKMYREIHARGCIFQNDVSADETEVDEKYEGAVVMEPQLGFHNFVSVYDFASLYPNIIRLYNVCYSTKVWDPEIPDEDCHVAEWTNEFGTKVRHRYIKKFQGVLPKIVESLIVARKKTKVELAAVCKELENPALTEVDKANLDIKKMTLNKRQESYKISANSCYGATGSKYAYIKFREGAETVTAMGRKHIMDIRQFVEKTYNAKIVYGDTDSIMCVFPGIKTLEDCVAKGQEVAVRINQRLTAPLSMEFEKVYKTFLILKKKKYCAKVYNTKGEMIQYDKKGVIATRRDSCHFIKGVFVRMIDQIMDRENSTVSVCMPEFTNMVNEIHAEMIKFITHGVPLEDLIVSFQLKDKYKTEIAQKVLSEKMKERGRQLTPGTRVQYILVKTRDNSTAQKDKVEDPEYYLASQETDHRLRLDHRHYVKYKFANCIDSVMTLIAQNFSSSEFPRYRESVTSSSNSVMEKLISKIPKRQRSKMSPLSTKEKYQAPVEYIYDVMRMKNFVIEEFHRVLRPVIAIDEEKSSEKSLGIPNGAA